MFNMFSRFFGMFTVWFGNAESVGRSTGILCHIAESQATLQFQKSTLTANAELSALAKLHGEAIPQLPAYLLPPVVSND